MGTGPNGHLRLRSIGLWCHQPPRLVEPISFFTVLAGKIIKLVEY